MSFDTPLVSIVVLTYNSERYVLETLESAKSQTYQNVELIITDDYSTDTTIEVCQRWLSVNSSRFTRSMLLENVKNCGIPVNCNRGFHASKGRYLKFIAGDDVLLDNCIEKNLNFIIKESPDIIYSNLIFFNSEGVINKRANYFLSYFSDLSYKSKLKVFCRNAQFLNSPSWFMKRELLECTRGFDESFQLLEDQVFLIKCLSIFARIKFLDEETVKYRVHGQSVVHGNNLKLIYELKVSLNTKRRAYLNLFKLKDFIYIVDANIYLIYLSQQYPRLLLKTLSKISLGGHCKHFVMNATNCKVNVFVKRMIS